MAVERRKIVDVEAVIKNTRKEAVLAVAKVGAGRAVKLAPTDRGQLRNSIAAESVSNTRARYGTNLVYAPIQEYGGTINVTPKMRGFLAAEKGWFLKKSTTVIRIPAQPYLRPSADWLKTNGSKAYAAVLKRGLRSG